MEIGELFIILAGILLVFDFILLLKAKSKAEAGEKKTLEYAFYTSAIACALIVASYLSFTWAFVSDNFSLREVYSYSSSSLAVWYKLGDPWIGASGSMLFLTFLFTIVYFAYRFKESETEDETRSTFRITLYKIADIFLIFFVLLVLLHSPFERFPLSMQMVPTEGSGLNPLLQTFWVLIHPPVVFLGYTFVFFAFALTLTGMITGGLRERERGTLKRSLYAAWLFLALGIALGGWWSYEVLGWGGYWSWDPVETASLLPWLALTAYFHLSPKRGESMAKEFTLLITFLAVIFSTALTRGGLLESVHAFGRSSVGPALMLFAAAIIFYFFYLWRKTEKPLYTFDVDSPSLSSISLFIAYWSLIFLLIICFLGDAAPIIGGFFGENPMTTSPEFYNKWCFPFTLAFVAALAGCNTSTYLNVKKYAGLILAVLGVGAILALLEQPTPNPLANFGLPLILVAGFAIAYNFALALRHQKQKWNTRLWGKTIVHLAIIIILIGVFVSSTTETESVFILAKPNSTIEALGMSIELNDFTIYPGVGSVYSAQHHFNIPEYSALKMDASIKEAGDVHQGAMWAKYYTNHGAVSEPLIISTLTSDIYIYMQSTKSSSDSLLYALMGQKIQPENFIVRVKRIPLIGLVWAGIILLGLGMAVLLVGEFVNTGEINRRVHRR
ncbi:MAG: cytochrome c biogenesis protein CcsA [Euryarchaeota archaeon]|nr:cytochrome c biogenesis protein CcsA [Euryarchaeota archaeon]